MPKIHHSSIIHHFHSFSVISNSHKSISRIFTSFCPGLESSKNFLPSLVKDGEIFQSGLGYFQIAQMPMEMNDLETLKKTGNSVGSWPKGSSKRRATPLHRSAVPLPAHQPSYLWVWVKCSWWLMVLMHPFRRSCWPYAFNSIDTWYFSVASCYPLAEYRYLV